jgi:hypothetical protein
VNSGTGMLPVRHRGIGILPMIHGLQAHATVNRLFTHPLGAVLTEGGRIARHGDRRIEGGGAGCATIIPDEREAL